MKHKPVRHTVRVILIRDEDVLAIRYTTKLNFGFYDLPGGKIEEGETSIQAAKREFREETTMEVDDLKYAGELVLEYPERVFDFEVYVAGNYKGNPARAAENEAVWIKISELLKDDKIFPVIRLLGEPYRDQLADVQPIKEKFVVDDGHRIVGLCGWI